MSKNCERCGRTFMTDRKGRRFCTKVCGAEHRWATTLESRFWVRVDKSDSCWLWVGGRDGDGYGELKAGRKKIMAHRFAYEILVGPIPDSLTLDHLCRVRVCVNPDHLEPVTSVINVMRGESPWAINARKTHCVRGHLLEGSNLCERKDGRRECRTCTRQRHAARRAASVLAGGTK